MNLKEFAQDFIDTARTSAELSGTDYESEIVQSILDYMSDSGEVISPIRCNYRKSRCRINAYDYNSEAESLDLFYFEKADTIAGKINDSKVYQGFNYIMKFYRDSLNGTLLQNIPDNDRNGEVEEVVRLVQSSKGNISQLRVFFLTDGLTDPGVVPASVESDDGEYIIEYIVWDMQRVYQQHNIRAGKEKVEIDFPTNYNTELQCLKMNEQNPYVDAYLAIIPGKTLARIYKQYQHALLEKNVRTFLQFKGKVNKEIRKTLRERPDMFFSFNNGISTTASEVEFTENDGTLYITRLYDWQIVNGGQTTASIAASLSDRSVDLSKVFVPMKVSVIKDTAHADEIVKSISVSANSQTAIKNSDLSANDQYLVDMENCSRSIWVPNGSNKPVCKWYFERTRGQYLDQLAQLNGYDEKSFRIEYPKNQKVTKTDIAKYEVSWRQRPYDVCKGAERNYVTFVAEIKKDRPVITPAYYKRIIAECILFNTIDAIVRSKDLGGYKANMNAYIMSSISILSEGNLDFTYIWEHQEVQPEVARKIELLVPVVWKHLTETATGLQSSNVSEWSKKTDCWSRLKLKLADIEKFSEEYLQKEINEDGSFLNESQQNKIKEAESYPAQYWFALADWAKSNNAMTPIDRHSAYNFGTLRSQNKPFKSLKQALTALRIAKMAKEQGFNA